MCSTAPARLPQIDRGFRLARAQMQNDLKPRAVAVPAALEHADVTVQVHQRSAVVVQLELHALDHARILAAAVNEIVNRDLGVREGSLDGSDSLRIGKLLWAGPP
jgi:hypothetical protein